MAMSRDKRSDRIAANAAPASKNTNENRSANRAAAAFAAQPRWLKPLADYDRHERREYQVSRYG
jgi:hypothetical protein